RPTETTCPPHPSRGRPRFRRTHVRVRHFLTGTFLLAGCYSHPETTPHPHTVIVAGAPKRIVSDSSKSAPKPVAPPATASSATADTKSTADAGTTAVSTMEVTKSAFDVFGDSIVDARPAKSDSTDEPTWDMDV